MKLEEYLEEKEMSIVYTARCDCCDWKSIRKQQPTENPFGGAKVDLLTHYLNEHPKKLSLEAWQQISRIELPMDSIKEKE